MDIQKFLLDQNIEPKKSWDQLFLRDDALLEEEIELAEISSSDTVLEIGAGFGNLTEKLAKGSKVIAIERDKRFLQYLKKIENVTVIHGNALKILKENRKNSSFSFNKIVSNIPYSLSKKIILEIMKHKWEIAVLIVQKEFADKLASNSKLSLLTEDCCKLEISRSVPANAFYPAALESSLICMRQKKPMDEKFWLFINEIFRYRNKDIINVVDNCPKNLARKKIHQLSLKNAKELYQLNK
jgi:16S rRNA (adenine1518-N6/adenine1519-N6)-dimethyltransferase